MVPDEYKPLTGEIVSQARSGSGVEVVAFGELRSSSVTLLIWFCGEIQAPFGEGLLLMLNYVHMSLPFHSAL